MNNIIEVNSPFGMDLQCASRFPGDIECDSLIEDSLIQVNSQVRMSLELVSIIYVDDITDWDGEIF